MRVVISQSMYFPWVGLLEQICLADIFVHYDDVQFTRGFYNRVQVKTAQGSKWLTVPLRDKHRGQKINEVKVDNREDWRRQHVNSLKQAYRNAPFCDDMIALVEDVLSKPAEVLPDISRASLVSLAKSFGLEHKCTFLDSSTLGVLGRSSQRLCDIVMRLGGDEYVTGHGAKNYLDHNLFESKGIKVSYMRYLCNEYPQLHGKFNPYVTALDLVANCGRDGGRVLMPKTVSWKEFIK